MGCDSKTGLRVFGFFSFLFDPEKMKGGVATPHYLTTKEPHPTNLHRTQHLPAQPESPKERQFLHQP